MVDYICSLVLLDSYDRLADFVVSKVTAEENDCSSFESFYFFSVLISYIIADVFDLVDNCDQCFWIEVLWDDRMLVMFCTWTLIAVCFAWFCCFGFRSKFNIIIFCSIFVRIGNDKAFDALNCSALCDYLIFVDDCSCTHFHVWYRLSVSILFVFMIV